MTRAPLAAEQLRISDSAEVKQAAQSAVDTYRRHCTMVYTWSGPLVRCAVANFLPPLSCSLSSLNVAFRLLLNSEKFVTLYRLHPLFISSISGSATAHFVDFPRIIITTVIVKSICIFPRIVIIFASSSSSLLISCW